MKSPFLRRFGMPSPFVDNETGFSPALLFSASEPGLWLDISDSSALFQDVAGTTPVTAAGQAVRRVSDRSGRGNHALQSGLVSLCPTYQVDDTGRGYLSFDGVDDFLVTPTITPGTDKVQVFAGARKLSDAARAMVAELTNAATGRFSLEAPQGAAANYGFASGGSTPVTAASAASFAAPETAVLTGIGDIAADTLSLRRNGTQIATSANNQGTGNYSAAPIYIGRRGGTTLPFNGRIYGLVVRFGPNLDAGTITQTEQWIGLKTGVSV